MENSGLLDNPIWHALNTNQANLAEGDNLARIYPRDMLPMAGLKEPDNKSFAALSSMSEPGKRFGLCLPDKIQLPDDWKLCMQFDTAQMVRIGVVDDTLNRGDEPIVRLTGSDVQQMKELAELTKPGPFTDRTIEFGPFYGIKYGDMLVAMAGQRMQLNNFTEISGVCTHPDFQGKGYARLLVNKAADNIADRGQTAFLHVIASNTAAIKSYTACGFTQRRLMQYLIIEKI